MAILLETHWLQWLLGKPRTIFITEVSHLTSVRSEFGFNPPNHRPFLPMDYVKINFECYTNSNVFAEGHWTLLLTASLISYLQVKSLLSTGTEEGKIRASSPSALGWRQHLWHWVPTTDTGLLDQAGNKLLKNKDARDMRKPPFP